MMMSGEGEKMYRYVLVLAIELRQPPTFRGRIKKCDSKILLRTNILLISVEQWIAGEKFFVMKAQKPSSREITPMFCGLLDVPWFLLDTTR